MSAGDIDPAYWVYNDCYRWRRREMFSLPEYSFLTTNNSQQWTWQAGSTHCPKCYKPYIYVGDVVGDPRNYICQCGVSIPSVFNAPALQGWECPRCHQVNGPFVQKCDCGPKAKSGTTSGPVNR